MEHHEAFWLTGEFWVLVAFVIFIVSVAKPAWRTITGQLDARADSIRDDLEEAERLREEAQKMLGEAERKQRDSFKHAAEIVSAARGQAKRLTEEARGALAGAIERRMRHAEERIEQAEAQALAEVRAAATEIALHTTRILLAENLSDEDRAKLADSSIGELPERLR